MKIKFLLLLFLFASLNLIAQKEFGKKNKAFPINSKQETFETKPIDVKPIKANPFSNSNPLSNSEPFFKPSTNLFSDKKEPSFVIGANKDEILNQPQFINPNADVLDKLNGKTPKPVSEDFIALRGDKEFCEIKTSSEYIYVIYRDFGDVDGDLFKIMMNGKDISGLVELKGYYQEIKIKIEKGFNKIDFEILNVGSISPNTAEFQFSSSPGVVVCADQWALLKGFKAIVKVFRE